MMPNTRGHVLLSTVNRTSRYMLKRSIMGKTTPNISAIAIQVYVNRSC